MFYSQFILAKKGPLGTIWIAAHLERKLRKNQVADTDIGVSVDSILSPDVPIALRLSSHLLLGVVRIYSRKVGYLFDDCSEALLKVKQAFRATAVDLPPEESKAPYHSITLPETFELDDFELPDSDIFQGNYVDHHVSSREQITLQDTLEGVVYSTSKFGLDERFGDGESSGLDLDEELFLDKVAAAGDASMSSNPQVFVEPMTPLKQEEHNEGMAANSESMIDGVDRDADFMDCDHAPCTPGLVEEPNLSNIQEKSACEDHLVLEDQHLTEFAEPGSSENLSGKLNVHDGSKLLENQSNTDAVHCLVHEENGYHLGDMYDKQLEPDGQLPPSGIAIDPVSSDDPALSSRPFSVDVHQVNANSSALECVDEILAASDGQRIWKDLQCTLSGMDKIDVSTHDSLHPEPPPLPIGVSSTKVDYDVSALTSIRQPVPEDISPSNQTSLKAQVSNNADITGNLDTFCTPSNAMEFAGESQDISCLEMPKSDACPNQSVDNADTTGAHVHFLRPCDDASKSSCMSTRVLGSLDGNIVSECTLSLPGETCHATGGSEQISKENLMKEPTSCEDIQSDFDKSNDRVDDVIPEDFQMENLSSSAASALPPPEKLLSVPEGLSDLPRNIFPEATPGYLARIDEADAGSKFISGKKRSFTESTLTEQSLNSAESSKMAHFKKTSGFIPDDDDLLSSILVGRSSALKLKPTPPPSVVTSSKRQRSAPQMSASKRKVLMDDTMVLHGDMIRQQLIDTEDIRRVRHKAPCTHAEISVIQKHLLEDEIFSEAILTGESVELASLHKQTFDLSTVKVSPSDVSCSHSETVVEPKLTSEYAENPTLNLDEQCAAMFNEPHVARKSGMEGSDELFVARDDSKLGAVETTFPTESREVDDHDPSLHNDASQLQPDTINNVVVANCSHLVPLDNAAEIGTEETRISGAEAAEATDTASAAEVLLSCPNNGGLGEVGDITAGLPLTDLFHESRRDDASNLAEVSCASPNRAPAVQLDDALESLNNDNPVEGSDLPENYDIFTSEAEVGTKNRVEDAVLLEAVQDSGTVEGANNVEEFVVENGYQSFADNGVGTEQPIMDASCEVVNVHMLDHSIGAGEYPYQQDDFAFNMMSADVSDVNLGGLNDLKYSPAGDDTGFLNFDDDEEAEAADDCVPDADVTRITENSGWSSRTRAVAKYFQTLFIKESEYGRKPLSTDNLLVGKTRKEASRLFFEALVLKTRDYIHVEQVIPFDDITIKPQMKLMKSDF